MEMLVIVALLASNLFLIGKVLRKNDASPPAAAPPEVETTPPTPVPIPEDGLVGRSHVDPALISIIREEVKEEVARVKQEFTDPKDVEIEEPEPQKPQIPTIPQEQLDEAFSHKTVGESFGDPPMEQDPQPGDDFKALESAVRVAKDEPHTPEEASAAKETLKNLQGTVIADRLSLDPKVRKRILSIIYQDDDAPLTDEAIAKKKVVFSKTLDTKDIDLIDFNILT